VPEADVSIVIATYNRSAVLRHVLAVLRLQTCVNWEAIVVGDACTDDTADVVASFGDPRLRFVNLATNHGEQSAPNNEGVRLARGRFVAFLNHDDLWRPDHLNQSLAHLTATGADLVYSWMANLLPDGTVVLLGVSPRGGYTPAVVVPASTWVVRREAIARVGPWSDGWAIRLPPSQDWIWRAARAGLAIRELPRISVVGLPSGSRPGAYTCGSDAEHAMWAHRIASDAGWPEELLSTFIRAQANGGRLPPSAQPLAQLSWAVRNSAAAAVARLGGHPLALYLSLRYPGRGGFLRWLRRQRGLPARRADRERDGRNEGVDGGRNA
jgi:glycosyltransferase involved in cell wall biosynthesis